MDYYLSLFKEISTKLNDEKLLKLYNKMYKSTESMFDLENYLLDPFNLGINGIYKEFIMLCTKAGDINKKLIKLDEYLNEYIIIINEIDAYPSKLDKIYKNLRKSYNNLTELAKVLSEPFISISNKTIPDLILICLKIGFFDKNIRDQYDDYSLLEFACWNVDKDEKYKEIIKYLLENKCDLDDTKEYYAKLFNEIMNTDIYNLSEGSSESSESSESSDELAIENKNEYSAYSESNDSSHSEISDSLSDSFSDSD